jgi:hypothetical protein
MKRPSILSPWIRRTISRLVNRAKPRLSGRADTHPVNERLVTEIKHARDEAQQAYVITRDIGGNLQWAIDEADATIPLVPYMSPPQAEGMIGLWSSLASQAGELKGILGEISMDSDAVGGTASLSSARASGIFTPGVPFFHDSDFQNVWRAYEVHASRPQLKDEVEKLLIRFGLDKPQHPTEKSPLEQFNTAHEAFTTPVTPTAPASTSLIPLRECIHSVLDGLSQARPIPERTGKNQRRKVISIGSQLRIDSVPQDVVQEWADEWHDLNSGDLSGAKRKDISRDEWQRRLRRGTLFLHSLLKGLDPSKFRQ